MKTMTQDERGGPLRRGDDIPIYSRSRRKPILCLDFDGVIHSYKSGWKGETIIYDPPVDGALDFIQAALEHFRVMIYSSRSSSPGGIMAMKTWLFAHCRTQPHRDFWWLDIEWPLISQQPKSPSTTARFSSPASFRLSKSLSTSRLGSNKRQNLSNKRVRCGGLVDLIRM